MLFSQKCLLFAGSFFGFVSVALGAFGAHALKHRLSSDMLGVFEVGARYQMYHVFAIFIAVWISTYAPSVLSSYSGWLFVAGIIIFSGSLYLLALTGIKTFGAITPIGGVLLLVGWVLLAIAIIN